MALFLYSESFLLLKTELDKRIADFKKSDPSLLNFFVFESPLDLEKVVGGIKSTPFLSENKLIILKNVSRDCDIKIINSLLLELEKIPDFSQIIWSECGKEFEKKAFFKKITKNSNIVVRKIEVPAGLALKNLLESKAGEYSLRLSPKAFSKIMTSFGGGFDKLLLEFDKICLYCKAQNNDTINEADVELLMAGEINETIFKFLDCITQKNRRLAFSVLNKLIISGQNELYIASMLVYQFRILYLVKELSEQKIPDHLMAKELGIHPFVVKKNKSFALKFSFKELEDNFFALYDFEMAIKTGKLEGSVGLQLLILELTKKIV